ncbi:MAG: Adaptive-response sensory-kinase SasA [Verrucomicrobiae bacterium]|nr:Adaptive-response sensory-kinase SasA [Verrucomicrobiae bacterium]
MTTYYFYLVLLNAAVCLACAAIVFWKNRHQLVGPLVGVAWTILTLWLVGFAQYFREMPEDTALAWAKFTLATGILYLPFFFHGLCSLIQKTRQYAVLIVFGYLMTAVFIGLLFANQLIEGLRTTAYLNHYVKYDRFWYPLLSIHLVFWQVLAAVILGIEAWRNPGYKRTQLVYFIVAWVVGFLTTSWLVLPLEYDVNVQPFGFYFFPINLVFLAYALSKARVADFNVVIARVLMYVVTVLVVAALCLLFVGIAGVVSPNFLAPNQALFTVLLSMVIAMVLAATLPRFLPRMERLMQERMFGKRYGYQDALAGLVQEISHLANLDELYQRAAMTVHSQMQLSRVLILMQDSLSGQFRLQAESGLPGEETTEGLSLRDDSAIVRWLQERKDLLVRDEVQRTEPAEIMGALATELDRLQAAVCVPMNVDSQLVGIVCLGPKANNEMFFVSDLKVLETLATEVGLAVKYRRMEEQIFRKNKLIELGTIAAGVAHEIRNPLASIRTFAQLLPDQIDDPEFKQEFSKLVLKDVDRITKVVESMLAFARPAQVTIAEHKATDLVEEAVLLVQARLKSKRIELSREFHEEPLLRVDRQQILQVLVNLLSNAADALPEQGKIRVATGVKMLESVEQAGNGADRYVVIEVADNGPGIPPLLRNRIFDPFFTTKKEGTGLGLSISQKIARDHGGIITVSSVEGKGTTFQVNLPVAT